MFLILKTLRFEMDHIVSPTVSTAHYKYRFVNRTTQKRVVVRAEVADAFLWLIITKVAPTFAGLTFCSNLLLLLLI